MTLLDRPAREFSAPTGKVEEAVNRGGDMRIFAHGEAALPNESVGFLWSDGTTSPLRNQAQSPERFAVGPTQMAEVLAAVNPEEKTLVAFYHSHPQNSANLSQEDQKVLHDQHKLGVGLPWLVSTPSGFLVAWWWADDYHGPLGTVLRPYSWQGKIAMS